MRSSAYARASSAPPAPPLVEDGRLFLNVGGREQAGLVAFDARTGRVLWTATDDEASYSSPGHGDLGRPPPGIVFHPYRTGFGGSEERRGPVPLSLESPEPGFGERRHSVVGRLLDFPLVQLSDRSGSAQGQGLRAGNRLDLGRVPFQPLFDQRDPRGPPLRVPRPPGIWPVPALPWR